jgi:hypothetical protein
VDRPDRQDRRRRGKPDPLDAVSAARAALPGRAPGVPRGRDGQVEAIRALMVAKRTARAQRTQTINQARALLTTGPDGIRTRFSGQAPGGLVAGLAALRPRPGCMVRYHTLLALRELGRRAHGSRLGSDAGGRLPLGAGGSTSSVSRDGGLAPHSGAGSEPVSRQIYFSDTLWKRNRAVDIPLESRSDCRHHLSV